MSQPRQQYYNFAHRVLKGDAHTEQKLWSYITGDKADSYAQMRWHDAGQAAGENHPPEKLLWVAPIKNGDVEIIVLHMPPPENPTEAYYAAFVKSPQQPFPLRYFVVERNSDGSASWAEWRPNMRVRGEQLQEWPADLAKRVELPLPYLATFVEAIMTEVTAFPNILDFPKELPKQPPVDRVRTAAASTPPPASNKLVIGIVAVLLALAAMYMALR